MYNVSMELSGRVLSEQILQGVREKVAKLAQKGIIPELAIITVGGEETWLSYVSQKLKTAERLGIKTVLTNLSSNKEDELLHAIQKLNNNTNVHGIIVQRPIPQTYSREKIVNSIENVKDIDGFRSDSLYIVPVLLAIQHFIREAYGVITASDLKKVLINKAVCVVGKGETAGGPVTKWLSTLGVAYTTIDSKTKNPCQELKKADLIICAVGKSGVVKSTCLKQGVVLIGVGTHKENGKLTGDYYVEDIKKVARIWTPTPGGVGPLNLAYLFQNLVKAAEKINKE